MIIVGPTSTMLHARSSHCPLGSGEDFYNLGKNTPYMGMVAILTI